DPVPHVVEEIMEASLLLMAEAEAKETNCMTNHVIDQCFKKHGYPPHMQQGGATNNCYNNGNEEDSKSIAYDEDNGDMDTSKLFFT
ncbi:hypothetical protein A2U01_0053360, partial [Trifolium medium]|nr:hypothetical protein [Trifolium medium]